MSGNRYGSANQVRFRAAQYFQLHQVNAARQLSDGLLHLGQ